MDDQEKGKLMQDLVGIFSEDMYPKTDKKWDYSKTIKRVMEYIEKNYIKKPNVNRPD